MILADLWGALTFLVLLLVLFWIARRLQHVKCKQLLGQLQDARKVIDDLKQTRHCFQASMVHDLQRPIITVVGMLELAMKKADQGVMDRLAIEVAACAAQESLESLLSFTRDSGSPTGMPGQAGSELEQIRGSSQSAVSAHSLNILVVEEHCAGRLLVAQQLNFLGHRVCDVENHVQGLSVWTKDRFDVVIVAGYRSYGWVRWIRAQEQAEGRTACLILGLVMDYRAEAIVTSQEAGVDQCLLHPVSLDGWRDSLALASAQSSSSMEKALPSLFPDLQDELDLASLQQLTQGDEASIRLLLAELANSNQQDLVRLPECLAGQDLQGLADLAHGIKGGARIVGARKLAESCEALEAACQVDDLPRLAKCVDRVYCSMKRLGRMLEHLKSSGSLL